MAAKKVSPKKSKKTAAKKATKTAKVPFYSSPNRLFAAAGDKKLPRGTAVSADGTDLSAIKVRAGTEKACVYEGTVADLLGALLGAKGLKVKAIAIPSPAVLPSAPPSA